MGHLALCVTLAHSPATLFAALRLVIQATLVMNRGIQDVPFILLALAFRRYARFKSCAQARFYCIADESRSRACTTHRPRDRRQECRGSNIVFGLGVQWPSP